MNVLVIGANGQVGTQVIEQLKESDHQSVALVRKEEQIKDLESAGADKVVLGDLEEDFSHAFDNVDAVVFAAGSGGSTGADKTMLIDLWGAVKAVNYAEKHDVKHFVLLSATDSLDPDAESDKMKPYAVAKHMADDYLQKSSLAYTTVHPGPLKNDEATGKVDVKAELTGDPGSYEIPRGDVARVLVGAIGKENLMKKSVFIKSGDHSVEDALSGI